MTPVAAKQDGADFSGGVGARKAAVIYLVRLHYVTMSKILSNYHLTKNVKDIGAWGMTLGWVWSEVMHLQR